VKFLALVSLSCAVALAQQVADSSFEPPLGRDPRYKAGAGPRVLLDEAHSNFHTAEGRYLACAKLLRRDGYTVDPNKLPFTRKNLAGARVLIIANALHAGNAKDWNLPRQSAFTPAEIAELTAWIREDGGSLFLIADHMPFAGAAADLGRALGVEFNDGYAADPGRTALPDLFTRESGSLRDHEVTAGIPSIGTFTGSAFRFLPEQQGVPLLVLGPQFVSVKPKVIGRADPDTPKEPVGGWLQGAVLTYGKGRVAIFGEAAMFSAQLAGPNKQPMGMNHPKAEHNPQLLLNLVAWLSGPATSPSPRATQ
jgi:hypothetical protein